MCFCARGSHIPSQLLRTSEASTFPCLRGAMLLREKNAICPFLKCSNPCFSFGWPQGCFVVELHFPFVLNVCFFPHRSCILAVSTTYADISMGHVLLRRPFIAWGGLDPAAKKTYCHQPGARKDGPHKNTINPLFAQTVLVISSISYFQILDTCEIWAKNVFLFAKM